MIFKGYLGGYWVPGGRKQSLFIHGKFPPFLMQSFWSVCHLSCLETWGYYVCHLYCMYEAAKIFFYILNIFSLCVCVCIRACHDSCAVVIGLACGVRFLSSTPYVPRPEVMLSRLVVKCLDCWAILLALTMNFNRTILSPKEFLKTRHLGFFFSQYSN